jgi:deoxyribonuclease-4
MSIAGGLPQAIVRARAVQATALQVFVKSSNQWAARPFAPGEVEAYREASREAGLERHTLAHASYLINLASPDDALWEKSVVAFRVELDRCDALGIPWLVVHPGAHVGSGVPSGVARVAEALRRVLPHSGHGAGVLLETTAGQGTTLGARFEELGEILKAANHPERAGICFDTCHVFAAGYDFRSASTYDETMTALDRAVGLDRLFGVHLNDSKGDLGSHGDVADGRLRDVPMVLETEKGDDLDEDRVNLGTLRSVIAG